ncbi:MAG: hypothetical protein IPK82_03390 [Polyangiaceae bacterium]|nr:hypothetical protein [Polyangiaceae bacterium]
MSASDGSSPPNTSTVPRLRIDEISVTIVRTGNLGARLAIQPPRIVTAAHDLTLPVFDGWLASAEFVVTLRGTCLETFTAALDFGKSPLGTPVTATVIEPVSGVHKPFTLTLSVPLRSLRPHVGTPFVLGVVLSPGNRTLPLTKTTLVAIAAKGPEITALDVLESTDSALFDGAERRFFDLNNPEEGIWIGTGKWRLRLCAEWNLAENGYSLDPKPLQFGHAFHTEETAGALIEDSTRRTGQGTHTETELLFDSGHGALLPVPQEGKDVPLDISSEHTLTFGSNTASLVWAAPLPIRVRDPLPLLKTFQRLSAVGIDFGTTATVAALYQKGYRSLLRLGSSSPGKRGQGAAESAENPAYLLIEDHEKLWAEMERDPKTSRFPNLLRLVRGSHAAYEARAAAPNAVIGELKSLPERILNLDHSPQLRDRERQRDFLLDEAKVRVLIRTYAYLLGRAINRPGQDVYLHYRLTHPAKVDERSRKLLEDEIRNGILLSIPQGIAAEEVSVEMAASEPEAFAAEVCPELAAHPALEPLITQLGELRFAVFDFGGGTLDIACGRFRPATEDEQNQFGSSTVIETLQVSGDDHLGGDYLTHELVWLAHQNEKHLPEMEDKEVPMMRPVTVPPNNLANKAFLYKRSLAGRQNRVRFERELGLEQVKYGPENKPKSAPGLTAAKLDGTEVSVSTFGGNLDGLAGEMREHLVARIRSGVKLMKSTLGNAAWGEGGDFKAQGVVILLAGNSSRSTFVEKVLAEELGLGTKEAPFRVWKPEGDAPFEQVVLYETPSRTERGVTIVGVTPKTAVALGALKIANNEVHLMRKAQGFSYFLGDLRGFPPKFTALIPMGTPPGDPASAGPHYVELGRWDTKTPLRVSKEYVPGKMTSNDPRVFLVPTGLPTGVVGRLFVCVTAPEEVALHLERDGQEPLRNTINLAKFMR